MAVTPTDIAKMANLARLQIAEADVPMYTRDLSNILDMVAQMSAVNTDGIAPLSNPLDAVQRLRPDVANELNARERMQTIAPDTADGVYLVPRVIE